jgi:hypothetical protein
MQAIVKFLRFLVCEHDWGAPVVRANFIAKRCRKCHHRAIKLGGVA